MLVVRRKTVRMLTEIAEFLIFLGALHGLHDSGKGSKRRLLVVTDADDKRAAQLQLVKDALAFGEFRVPPNAYEFAQSKEFRTPSTLSPARNVMAL